MATPPTNTPPSNSSTPTPTGIDAWVPYTRQISYGMLAVGGGLAILTLVLGYHSHWSNIPVLVWGLIAAGTLLVAGGLYLFPEVSSGYAPNDFLRMMLLLVLSVIGLATTLLGLLLPFTRYRAELGGDLESWRKHSGTLTFCLAAFVGGLVLMFVGLSLGRGYERTRPALRRLLYGYNAVFSSLLLALILLILNVLVYSPVWPFTYLNGQPIDWTKGGLYTLKKESRDLIGRVKEPVKLYIILPTQDPRFQNMVDLAKNCRAINPLFTYQTMSPQISDPEIRKLKEKYHLANPAGVLVEVGTGPGAKSRHIPADNLIKFYTDAFGQQVRDSSGRPRWYFTSELAVMKTLQQLAFNSKPVKVYFTQGNGEAKLKDPRNPLLSLERLSLQFDRALFDFQPLPFSGPDASKEIPADADIVVIPGANQRLSKEALEALRDYLDKRHGKLIVLLGPVDLIRGGAKTTGLEGLLHDYQVDVGNNRVLYARQVGALEQRGAAYKASALVVDVNDQSTNPIVAAFKDEQKKFFFVGARTIGKLGSGPAPSPYNVDEIIQTIPDFGAWADTHFDTDPDTEAEKLRDNRQLYEATVSPKPLPLAVAVSEGNKPRIVVYGSSYFLSDELELEQTILSDNNLDLFRASLAWLVDRPELNFPVDDKPPQYTLTAPEGRVVQMMWLPGALMLLGVITLGGGVWVVRRR